MAGFTLDFRMASLPSLQRGLNDRVVRVVHLRSCTGWAWGASGCGVTCMYGCGSKVTATAWWECSKTLARTLGAGRASLVAMGHAQATSGAFTMGKREKNRGAAAPPLFLHPGNGCAMLGCVTAQIT